MATVHPISAFLVQARRHTRRETRRADCSGVHFSLDHSLINAFGAHLMESVGPEEHTRPPPGVPGVGLGKSANVFLPPALQPISTVHDLQSMCVSVPMPFGPFAVITAPASVFGAVTGLTAFTIAVLIVNALLMRKVETDYSSD